MNEKELMLTSILDCERVDLATDPKELTEEQQAYFQQMQQRRAQGEPVQYIIGKTDFMGITLRCDRRALIPRPETEILVDLAIKTTEGLRKQEKYRILDLGVGSGNISIAMAKHVPNAAVTAVDISRDALDLARANARLNGVEGKIDFRHENLSVYFDQAIEDKARFDMVLSNPPYIPTGQLDGLPVDVRQEPRSALDGGADGLHYCREIIQGTQKILKTNGYFIMELGDKQRFRVEAIFNECPRYKHIEFFKDYVGTDRIVMARLRKIA